MKAASILGLLISFTWPLVGLGGQASVWAEDDWRPLTNEPSRQELLRSHMPLDLESVPRKFAFPENTLDPASGPRTFGIDISHYSPSNLPFSKFAESNIRYVYIKATQGVDYKDAKFRDFWNSIGELPEGRRIARGAYHFLSSSSDPELQAERFVAYVNLQGGIRENDLPPGVDLEWDKASSSGPDRWRDHTPEQIVAATLKFLTRVEELTGRAPVIYTSRAWWRERGIAESEISRFSRYKLWIADYSTATLRDENPRAPGNVIPELWQFTDRAKISGGPAADLDGNVYDGTLEEFNRQFLGK